MMGSGVVPFIRVALASSVGVGMGYLLYRMYSKPHSEDVTEQQEDNSFEERPLVAWRLEERNVLVIGGIASAAVRVSALLEASARVVVVCPIGEVVSDLKERIQKKEVSHVDRQFRLSDLQSVDMAIYCLNDMQTAKAVTEACRKLKLPVNVADHPELCDFLLIGHDKSIAGVKTSGKAPFVHDEQVAPSVERLESYAEGDSLGQQVESVLTGIFDGYSAAKYVGTSFSDVFLDLSFNEEVPHVSYFAVNHSSHATRTLNMNGQSVKLVALDIRAGSGNTLYGALANSSAHVFTPSSGLAEMIPTLYKLTRESRASVIHVATQSVGEDMLITDDVTDILPVFHTGASVFTSSSVQDVHDVALVAHMASQHTSKPSVHFFDGCRTAREAAKAQVLSHDSVRKLVDEYNDKMRGVYTGSGLKGCVDSVEAAMSVVSAATGRTQKLFDYFGDFDAESVVVVVGSNALIVQDTISILKDRLSKYGKIGCISVKLVKPWSAKHFLSSIPSTTKRIAVIGPLLSDVASSFYLDAPYWQRRIPYIINVRHDKKALVPGHVHLIFEHLYTAATQQQQPKNLAINAHVELPDAPPPSSVRGELWGSTANLIESITRILSHSELHATVSPNQAAYVPGADLPIKKVGTTRIQIGTAPLSTVDKVQPVDFVACYDHTLLGKYNVLTSLKNNGVFLLNSTAADVDELELQLPSQTKREIASRRAKFYIYNGNNVGASHELAAYFLRSAALALLGGTENLLYLLHAARIKDPESVMSTVELLSSISPITVPSSWLDAPEMADLATFPQLRLQLASKAPSVGSSVGQLTKKHHAALCLLFPETYRLTQKLRPDTKNSFLVTVTVNRRLTPSEYERNVFHIEMDTTGTGLTYGIGEALGVHGHNDELEVDEFLEFYKLNPDDIVTSSFKGAELGYVHIRTVKQVFTQYLDIFGRPSKDFYQQLVGYATDPSEKSRLEWLVSAEGQEDFKRRVEETVTFAEVLTDFPSAHPPVETLIDIIPPIKPRHYSIASSMKMHPSSVHLLVVLVSWEIPKKTRYGQCTRYLAGLRVGEKLTVSVKPSVMTLPPLDTQPIVMAGLGTGMAPFRAFIQERAVLKAQGVEVGPIALYFGSRSRFAEYLYGEELEAYNTEGLLTYLRLAFSRDQPQKLYIQHKITEDSKIMWDMLVQKKGHFYLCGPTWPEADVREAILRSFREEGKLEHKAAEQLLEHLKEEERYILELY